MRNIRHLFLFLFLILPLVGPETQAAQAATSGQLDCRPAKSLNQQQLFSNAKIAHIIATRAFANSPPQFRDRTEISEEDFRSGKVRSVQALAGMDKGVSETYRVTLEDGTQGYFKPSYDQHWGHEMEHELAAYQLDQLLGFDLVPLTIGREIEIHGEKVFGSFQLHREGKSAAALGSKQRDGKLRFLDYLLGNCDRHRGNYLLHNGDTVAIDNGAAFNNEICEHQALRVAERVDEIHEKVLTALKGNPKSSHARFKKGAGDLISEERLILALLPPRELIPSQILKKLKQTPDSALRRTLHHLTEQEFSEFIKRKNRAIGPLAQLRAMKQDSTGIGDLVRKVASQTRQPKIQEDDQWLFWRAIENNEISKVIGLVRKSGIDPNMRDSVGRSPLTQAISNNYLELAEALLDAGADINLRDGQGNTPLFVASQLGQPWSVRVLLKRGALKNLTTRNGESPLVGAKQSRKKEVIVKMLLDAGATPASSQTP